MGGDALNRRRFLEFLAASPLLATGEALAQELHRLPDPSVWAPRTFDKLIASPREALDVFDFELVAHRNVPPAHFGYMASGVDDEVTLRANREGFQKFQLKPHRLIDVGKIDTTHGAVRRNLWQPDRHRSDRLEPRLPRRRRTRRVASGQDRQSSHDAVDRGHDVDRGGDHRPRPPGLVPTLSHRQMGSGAGSRPPRREGGSRGHCHHGRCAGPAELGDALPPDTARHARLLRLPPALDAELRAAQAQFRRDQPCRPQHHRPHHAHLAVREAPARHGEDPPSRERPDDRRGRQARGRQRPRRHRCLEPWRPRRRQRPLDHRRPARDHRSGRRAPAGDRRFQASAAAPTSSRR